MGSSLFFWGGGLKGRKDIVDGHVSEFVAMLHVLAVKRGTFRLERRGHNQAVPK